MEHLIFMLQLQYRRSRGHAAENNSTIAAIIIQSFVRIVCVVAVF